MNCCNHNSNGTNENNQKNQHARHKHGPLSHMLMMVLCCGAPLLILLVVPLLGSNLPGLKAFLVSIAPFICPLMMIGMIPMMLRHGKQDDGRRQEKQIDKDETLDAPKRDRLN